MIVVDKMAPIVNVAGRAPVMTACFKEHCNLIHVFKLTELPLPALRWIGIPRVVFAGVNYTQHICIAGVISKIAGIAPCKPMACRVGQ